jgi:hypothetical protein
MALIDADTAWEILFRYVEDCLEVDSPSLLAVFAIGSLPAGYYRPGQSDIDAVLLVQDGAEKLWGCCSEPSSELKILNQTYRERYRIPKDFGPFPISASELFPPYDPHKELVCEIARLKIQGRRVYGCFDLDVIPMPTGSDALADAQHFEEWWRDEFSPSATIEDLSAAASTNIVLLHLARFLWIKRDVIEFDKHKILSRYLGSEPPFIHPEAFSFVARSLAGMVLSQRDEDRLRASALRLRSEMNGLLGIHM